MSIYHDSKLVKVIVSTNINWVLVTSLLRGLELATGVVNIVEVLLEVLPWGVRRQQKSLVVTRDTG